MRCTYRKRFVPQHVIEQNMRARDERMAAAIVRPLVDVAIVPMAESLGPVVEVELGPPVSPRVSTCHDVSVHTEPVQARLPIDGAK